MDDNLQGAWFINSKSDIVVAHEGKLSIVHERYTRIDRYNIRQTNTNYKHSRLQGVTFEDYYSQMKKHHVIQKLPQKVN